MLFAEIILAIATYVIARQFWACFKRDKYLRQVMSNESHLESFISRDVLENPSPLMSHFAEPNDVGYFINIKAISAADRTSTLRIKVLCTVALLAIAAVSYFIVPSYLLINAVVLFLAGLGALSEPAKRSALHHVMCLAFIFHKWHMKDPAECERFFQQAFALRPLYNVVMKIH